MIVYCLRQLLIRIFQLSNQHNALFDSKLVAHIGKNNQHGRKNTCIATLIMRFSTLCKDLSFPISYKQISLPRIYCWVSHFCDAWRHSHQTIILSTNKSDFEVKAIYACMATEFLVLGVLGINSDIIFLIQCIHFIETSCEVSKVGCAPKSTQN